MTSISDHGRICDSVFDSISSEADAPPRMSPVVVIRLRLQASPISAAAWAFSPAVATMTTRSAVSTSFIRSLVRPARSLSQPCMEKLPAGGRAPEDEGAEKSAAFPLVLAGVIYLGFSWRWRAGDVTAFRLAA